jgi:hypothetical protein
MQPDGGSSEAGSARPHLAGRRRRRPVRREHRVEFCFGDDEYGKLLVAASAAGLSLGAYAARATAAEMSGRAGGEAGHQALRDALGELVRTTSLFRKAGTLFNQAVRALNSTGQPPGNLAAWGEACMRYADRADKAAEAVRRAALAS